MSSPMIGIDLGTTYSCVAVFQHGKVEIIANDQGNRTTPSCVAFTDTQRFIGEAAKSQATRNPSNTVFEMKRLMGRAFNDPNVQEDTQNWPVKIVDNDGRPKVQVTYKGKRRRFTAQELSAMVLTKMKVTAEAYLGTKVKDAVITVPAYFNDLQRQATKDAATIAGLNTKRIINEPTAAALAYGLDKKLTEDHNVLVFDLGGGTFDVSVLTITDGTLFEVKSTAGDTHLGGGDFDNRLVHHFVDEFRRKYHLDVRDSPRAMRQLRAACEQAKIALSSCTETAVEIDCLYQEIYFYSRISRARFEELCIDLFRKTLTMVDKALDDACLTKSDIHEVVLAGGSTRIPRIQKLLQDCFAGRTLNRSIHPDEAVAYGAAVHAAALSGDASDLIKDVLLVDVVPLSLGTDICAQGIMKTLIRRNTRIPATKRATFYPTDDYQTAVHVGVYQGERKFVKDNEMLGELDVTGLPPLPKDQVFVLVEFNVDTDGIINVRAKERQTGRWKTLTIDNSKSRLHQVEIKRMLRETEEAEAEDDARCEALEAIQKLERYVFSACQRAAEAGDTLTNAENQTIRQRCDETIGQLDMGTLAGKDEVDEQLRTLQRQLEPLLSKSLPHRPVAEASSQPITRCRFASDATGYSVDDDDVTSPHRDTRKGAREEDASRGQLDTSDDWETISDRSPQYCRDERLSPEDIYGENRERYGWKPFTSVMDEVD